MIRVRYIPTARSAEPVVDVLLGHPDGPPAAWGIPALLDSAADRSVIPLHVADALGLPYAGTTEVEVAGGTVVEFLIYEASIRIDGVMDFILEVVAADEPRVLLGRDVLNAVHTHLDWPGRMLTLSAQPLLPPTP